MLAATPQVPFVTDIVSIPVVMLQRTFMTLVSKSHTTQEITKSIHVVHTYIQCIHVCILSFKSGTTWHMSDEAVRKGTLTCTCIIRENYANTKLT